LKNLKHLMINAMVEPQHYLASEYLSATNETLCLSLNDDGLETHINYFLSVRDTNQYIKFIVHRKGPNTWQIWTVNKHRRPYCTYIPLVQGKGKCIYMHPNHHYAITNTLEDALHMVNHSRTQYYSLANLPCRMWRSVRMSLGLDKMVEQTRKFLVT
jgi:hypothetical protein